MALKHSYIQLLAFTFTLLIIQSNVLVNHDWLWFIMIKINGDKLPFD